MRLSWALLAYPAVEAADIYAAVAQKADCTGAVGCKGYYRAFAATTSPPSSVFDPTSTVTGISMAAIGAQLNASAMVADAKVDVAGFRFKTPADTSDTNRGLSFYFGYLGATGNWDASIATSNVAGAVAEIVSSWTSIIAYYDNDGTAGFKWNVDAAADARWDIFNCAEGAAKNYDTIDPAGGINLEELTWTPIARTKVQCNTNPALADAPDGCEIYSFTTHGSNSSLPSIPIITFTVRIASQPVLINNVKHGPNFAKFDVTVQYPWAAVSPRLYSASTAKLAIVALNAGKAGSFVGSTVHSSDTDALVFTAGTSGHTSHYSFASTATIDGQVGAINTQVITGQQLIDFSCPLGSPCHGLIGITATSLLAGSLKIAATWLQGFGWKSSLTVHSLGTTAAPASVFWDPQVGAGGEYGGDANTAAVAIPSFLVLVATFLFY